MPAPSFLSKLPKPVLFGLYGAAGGLLGALLVGELVWSLLRPPPPVQAPEPPEPPPQVAVTTSARVMLYPGTENVIAVQAARDRFDGPILVTFDTQAPGLSAAAITVPTGQTSGQAKLVAAVATRPGTYQLTATATATPNGQRVTSTAAVEVTVATLPAVPARLAVTVSPAVHVLQGDKNAFGVQIARDGFDGPVTVSFTGLPEGVTVESVTVPAQNTRAEAVVTAVRDKVPGEWQVGVRAAAGQGPSAAAGTVVRVEPRPVVQPQLVVTASPEVHVYSRGRNTFGVQIARGGFEGPVTVEFAEVPGGVLIPPVVIPADRTEGTALVTAKAGARAGATRLAVKASGTTEGGDVTGETGMRLRVGVPPAPTEKSVVDVVFVLDVTGSMGRFIEGVKDGIGDFADGLKGAKIDARVALVAFRDGPNREASEVLKFNGEPFTTDIGAFKKAVGRLSANGGGDEPESSLDGLVEAAELKFRQKAARVLILITDAPPKTPDLRTRSVAACATVLSDKKIDQVHLVTRKVDLDKFYKPFLTDFNGEHFDLERVTKGGEKFAKILPELGRAIEAAVESAPAERPKVDAAPVARVPPAAAPPVAATPALPPPAVLPPDAAKKAVNPPTPAPPPKIDPPAVKGVQSSERYDAGSRGRLVLAVSLWTGALSALVCLALLVGQHHYLRGSLPSVGGALAGVGGGLAVGVAGGAAGQGLFLLADTESEAFAALFRVLGWALLGGLAGAGLALFIPNLKISYGLLGGALGGLAGAGAFLGVSILVGDLPGRLAGGLLLGFCIGLMVAAVEAAFRRAWLEVRFGEREVVTVNLGPEPVKVGGDAKLCTVWARGAAPVALRFWVLDGRVLCEDAVTRTQITAGDGTARTAGAVTIVVRTGRERSTTAPTERPHPVPQRVADDEDVLPLPMVPARSPAQAPKRSPAGTENSLPLPPDPKKGARPSAPPVPGRKPNISATTKAGEGCPQCGRKVPGETGQRYCMLCDETF